MQTHYGKILDRPGRFGQSLLAVKYWEIIADKLTKAGLSWGYCGAMTSAGWRYIVDAYASDGRRFVIESDELLSAFLELEALVNSLGCRQ
jgi:hypothetical protein